MNYSLLHILKHSHRRLIPRAGRIEEPFIVYKRSPYFIHRHQPQIYSATTSPAQQVTGPTAPESTTESKIKVGERYKMSVLHLEGAEIIVHLIDNVTQDELLNFPAFKTWLNTLQTNLALQHSHSRHIYNSNPYGLRSIRVQAVDRFGPRIGFIKMVVEVRNDSHETLPGAVFLRGASVSMMVVLQPSDLPPDSEEEKYVIMTVQPRIAAGGLEFVELVAGMTDGEKFVGAAAKEIEEEIGGLEIKEEELVNMSELALEEETEKDEECPKAMFPSAGGCDEYMPLFFCQKKISREDLEKYKGKLTGLRAEGEKITLKLVKLENLWLEGARDAKALGAYALWTGLSKNGKLERRLKQMQDRRIPERG